MRKGFIALLSVFSFLVLAAVVVGFFLPNRFTVTREIEVAAPPERLYELLVDLERWAEWGPWKDADESLRIELGEITSGVGAAQSWVGREGGGRLVFTEADPESGITFDLFFNEDAFRNVSAIRFTERAPGQCLVIWEMTGEVPVPVLGGYLARMMDGMIGPMFEQGLQKLKAAAEDGVETAGASG